MITNGDERRRLIGASVPYIVVASIAAAVAGAIWKGPSWPFYILILLLGCLSLAYRPRPPLIEVPRVPPGKRRWIVIDRRPISSLHIMLGIVWITGLVLTWRHLPCFLVVVYTGFLILAWGEDDQRKHARAAE